MLWKPHMNVQLSGNSSTAPSQCDLGSQRYQLWQMLFIILHMLNYFTISILIHCRMSYAHYTLEHCEGLGMESYTVYYTSILLVLHILYMMAILYILQYTLYIAWFHIEKYNIHIVAYSALGHICQCTSTSFRDRIYLKWILAQ